MKVTHMEKLLQVCVYYCFALTLLICIIMSVGMGVWCSENASHWWHTSPLHIPTLTTPVFK